MHTHTHTHSHTHSVVNSEYMWENTLPNMYTHIHIYSLIHTHTHILLYIYTQTHTHIHTYTHSNIYTFSLTTHSHTYFLSHPHTHMHTHTHTHTHTLICRFWLYVRVCVLFIRIWLILLNMLPSCSHFPASVNDFSFLRRWLEFHCEHFLHPFICWWSSVQASFLCYCEQFDYCSSISVIDLSTVRGQNSRSMVTYSAFFSCCRGPEPGLTRTYDFDGVKYFRIGQHDAKLEIWLKIF